MNNLNELRDKILKWSADRQILTNGNLATQTLKLVSEVGELADNVAKGKDISDDLGDCFVLLVNIAAIAGTDIADCAAMAYDEIKDRKGILTSNGTFVKDTDASYAAIRERELK